MPFLRRITFLLAVFASGCRSFEPPAAATLARVRPMPMAASLQQRFELELASATLSGTFDGVLAATGPGFRLQLFPDVGGKVFDLAVDAEVITAAAPGVSYLATMPFDTAPPHLALVLAAVFAELLAPVDGSRVLGERSTAAGRIEVQLAPALGCGTVTAVLGDNGAVVEYHCGLGWLQFTFHADGGLVGRGFTGCLRLPVAREPTGDVVHRL